MRSITPVLVVVLASGCGEVAEPHADERLGIARFEVKETAERSTVIGWSAGGEAVVRVEVFHGAFMLSPQFADGREGAYVVGRRLDVTALGQSLQWETEGFDATLHLPAPPPSRWALTAALRDPRVTAVLERWGIGFDAVVQTAEVSRPPCPVNGTHHLDCSASTKCPTVNPFVNVPSTCGGNNPTPAEIAQIVAHRVHQRAGEGNGFHYTGPALTPGMYDQSWIVQFCPKTATNAAFFAAKACPDAPGLVENTLYPTSCGPQSPGRCKSCPTYPLFVDTATIEVHDAGWSDGADPVKDVCVSVCGDGECDAFETCSSCTADCGCAAPETCGGGGAPDTCGCTPLTQCPTGYECGTIDDGCGGVVDCAGGATCEDLRGKKFWTCDAASHTCCRHGRCHPDDDISLDVD
jgi:hypothetical protein